jgi:hypothetical protein
VGEVRFACLGVEETGAEEVELLVEHPDFADRRLVRDVRAHDVVEVELGAGGTVYGTVLLEDGSPAVGEQIYAGAPRAHQRVATVDGSGRYELTRLEPGGWVVGRMRRSRSGASTVIGTGERRQVMVREGERTEVSFVPGVAVSGRVFVDGEQVWRSIFLVAAAPEEAGVSTVPVTVDESGWYTARLPMPGPWTFASRGARFTTLVADCPCAIDLYLETGAVP